MSALLNVIILLFTYLSFRGIYSSCSVSSIRLPDSTHILQSAYIPSSNTAYIFGGKGNTNVYKWEMSHSPGFVDIGNTPASDFYSYANAVATVDHLVYFVGVDRTNGALVHIFDTDTDTWLDNSNIARVPTPVKDSCIANNRTHIFSVGGHDSDSGDQLQMYDISRNVWSTSTIPIFFGVSVQPYWGQMCWMVDNVLYIFGGMIGNDWSDSTNGIYKWEHGRVVNGWDTVSPSLPQKISTTRAERHPMDDNIFIIGGYTDSNTVDTIYQFNVGTETITDTYYLTKDKDDHATDFVGNDLYVWGSRSYSTEIEICTGLVSITASEPTASPTELPSEASPLTARPSEPPTQYPSSFPSKAPGPLLNVQVPSLPPTKSRFRTTDVDNISSTEYKYNAAPRNPNGIQSDEVLMYFLGGIACTLCCIVIAVNVCCCVFKKKAINGIQAKDFIGNAPGNIARPPRNDPGNPGSVDETIDTEIIAANLPHSVTNPAGDCNAILGNDGNPTSQQTITGLTTPGEKDTDMCVQCGNDDGQMFVFDGSVYCANCCDDGNTKPVIGEAEENTEVLGPMQENATGQGFVRCIDCGGYDGPNMRQYDGLTYCAECWELYDQSSGDVDEIYQTHITAQ